MTDLSVELEEVVEMVRSLSPLDKVRLVEEVMTLLQEDLTTKKSGPGRSYYGIWPDASVSAEDIAEARREMWGSFPREDI
ncbi:MAG: hypothetical protein KIT52_07515 [Anaerolineae bacterium]|nr:hypothetical protein [Anaerolineae bacterium]